MAKILLSSAASLLLFTVIGVQEVSANKVNVTPDGRTTATMTDTPNTPHIGKTALDVTRDLGNGVSVTGEVGAKGVGVSVTIPFGGGGGTGGTAGAGSVGGFSGNTSSGGEGGGGGRQHETPIEPEQVVTQ